MTELKITTRRHLLNNGWSRGKLDLALENKTLIRAGRSFIAQPDVDPRLVMAAQAGCRLTCHDAAELYGLWTVREPFIHFWRSDGSPINIENQLIENRHSRMLKTALPMAPIVSLLDAVLHAIDCLPTDKALLIAESALVLGKLSFEDLVKATRGSRNSARQRLIDMIDMRSQSLLETKARHLLQEAGYRVTPQFHIRGLGHVDLLVEDKIIVELDGYKFHNTEQAFLEDRRRNNIAAMNGYLVVRFTFRDVFFNEALVLNQIRLALAALASIPLHV